MKGGNIILRAEQSRAEQSRAEQSRAEQSRAEIVEYDCLRVIATLLVVLGHCTYYKINTDFGGCDYSNLAGQLSIMFQIVQKVTTIIYLFHMPLFMALSGALFQKSLSSGKYSKCIQVILAKGKRLLIPFFVVSTFYCFPLKLVSGYYSQSQSVLKDFVLGQLCVQGNTHLWYCVALFSVFIIVYLLENSLDGKETLKLTLFFILSLVSSKVDVNLISYICQYTFWFYVGFYFEIVRNQINCKINRHRLLLGVAVTVLLYLMRYLGDSQATFAFYVFSKVLGTLLTLILCFCVYMFSVIISHSRIVNLRAWNRIKEDSFGIYLYSDAWNYIFLFVGTRLFGNDIFQNNVGAIAFYGIRFWGTLGISIVITECLKRCHLRYLF